MHIKSNGSITRPDFVQLAPVTRICSTVRQPHIDKFSLLTKPQSVTVYILRVAQQYLLFSHIKSVGCYKFSVQSWSIKTNSNNDTFHQHAQHKKMQQCVEAHSLTDYEPTTEYRKHVGGVIQSTALQLHSLSSI